MYKDKNEVIFNSKSVNKVFCHFILYEPKRYATFEAHGLSILVYIINKNLKCNEKTHVPWEFDIANEPSNTSKVPLLVQFFSLWKFGTKG